MPWIAEINIAAAGCAHTPTRTAPECTGCNPANTAPTSGSTPRIMQGIRDRIIKGDLVTDHTSADSSTSTDPAEGHPGRHHLAVTSSYE